MVEAHVEDLEDLDVVRCPQGIGHDLDFQGNGGGLPHHVLPERVEVIWSAHRALVVRWHRFRHRSREPLSPDFAIRPGQPIENLRECRQCVTSRHPQARSAKLVGGSTGWGGSAGSSLR